MDLLKLANIKECPCGRTHHVDIKQIIIKRGALERLPDIIKKHDTSLPVLIVCDDNTHVAAGKKVEMLLDQHVVPFNTIKLSSKGNLVPDKKAVDSIENALGKGAGLLLAVGSGTINDLTRFVAFKSHLPYISIPTAPSVDGFASTISALTIEGRKKTFPAKPPDAIIADIEVLSESPHQMKAAGIGDLLGKSTARMDWHIGNILKGEYFCEKTANLVQHAKESCLDAMDIDDPYNDQVLQHLMEGLVLSGLAISMVGNSRPASGSEHHVSHYLEMKALDGTVPPHLHGETVAFGTMLMTRLYLAVFQMDVAEIARLTGSNPQINGILLTALQENWEEISRLTSRFIMDPLDLEECMKNSRIPNDPVELGYDLAFLEDLFSRAKEMRERYTLLSLLAEIGLLEHFNSKVLQAF
ncbi:MAG: sn-glycerol-1-phosphate dehydrogenase [Candidatus Hodarchaeota archaeon]